MICSEKKFGCHHIARGGRQSIVDKEALSEMTFIRGLGKWFKGRTNSEREGRWACAFFPAAGGNDLCIAVLLHT